MSGYENRVTSDESFAEDRNEFAEIPVGAGTTEFYEVQMRDEAWRNQSNMAELGDVQLRWVTPVSGLTNRQSAAMMSRLDGELGTIGDALLEFGAVVALASDRYGSLPYVDGDGSADVRRDLWALSAQLQPLGIAVTPQVVEWGTLLNQINTPEIRDFDGVVIGWVEEFRIDNHNLFHSEAVDEPYGWAGTRDAEIDRLIDTLQLVVEREEAIPLWQEYQYRLLEVQPYTHLYHVERLAGLNRRLRDVALDARGEWINIRDWWIPADLR